MTLPLSKTLDPADYAELVEELQIVDLHFGRAREQHPQRRWEYALALRAIQEWGRISPAGVCRHVDVGGAGSPFRYMPDAPVEIVDPDETVSLAEYLDGCSRLASVVTCLSVLEHVDDLDRFCYHLSCLVAPGGMLFLTMDYCDGAGWTPDVWPADTYHFHWMRQRIFNAQTLGAMTARLLQREFAYLGAVDYTWRGPQVYDYTFASLALQKRA